jgi:hypothetical protein
MHFATRVRTWRVARLYSVQVLYSEIALPPKPFGIGHMYIYSLLLRVTDTMTSQNIRLSSWDTLYMDPSSKAPHSSGKQSNELRCKYRITYINSAPKQ